MFYYCTQYCNSVRMTCSIKRLLILTYLVRICLLITLEYQLPIFQQVQWQEVQGMRRSRLIRQLQLNRVDIQLRVVCIFIHIFLLCGHPP